MSVVVAVRDNEKIWLATDSQVTSGWTPSLILSQHSFKIFKTKNNINIGGSGSLRDLNIISTSDVDFISENCILKNNITFNHIVRDTVSKFFNELSKFQRLKIKDGITEMQSYFIIAYKTSCFLIGFDGAVMELDDMFAIGSGADVAESAYIILRDTDLSAKDKAVRAVMSACERDLFVNYPIIVTNTLIDKFELFDGVSYYPVLDGKININNILEEEEEEEEIIKENNIINESEDSL